MEANHYDISRAMELFDQQQYQEAFAAFADIYNHCENDSKRQGIFKMLDAAYHAPNVEELKGNYEHNRSLFEQYPYVWSEKFRQYEDLNFQLFPVSDEVFYSYDPQKDCFSGEYDAKTSNQMRYFFKDLDEPLQVKDEDNFYNLTFLNDNVRLSEDFAGDNHIYLFYSSMEPLERLMQTCDLKLVLEQQKFVFLIGKKNWKKYPIDFKKEFGMDYSVMKPSPVRIEEIKRFCFWYKHAHSGTGLSRDVLGASREVQTLSGHDFNCYSKINGKPLYFSEEFREVIADIDRKFTLEQIENLVHSEKYEIRLADLENYLQWLKKYRPAPHEYTVKELFCGYFLFQYKKRELNPRISPMFLYDPHMWDPSPHDNLILSFPYYTALTCMREPIMTFIRCNMIGIVGWNEFSTKYMLASDYTHAQFLNPKFHSCYYGYRFEDLKTKPKVVCQALCRHLNIPFESQMLQVESLDNRSGRDIRGFDQTPLHWDLSDVLSDFDKVRLQIFYEPIQKYYGYSTFSSEEHPISEKVARELFQIPFRFEYRNSEIFGDNAPTWNQLHTWIQEVLQNMWRKPFISPKLIPLEESNDE